MFVVYCLVLTFIYVTKGDIQNLTLPTARMVIGEEPMSNNQFSFLAYLRTFNTMSHDTVSSICGGSIISKKFILTAARCVEGYFVCVCIKYTIIHISLMV